MARILTVDEVVVGLVDDVKVMTTVMVGEGNMIMLLVEMEKMELLFSHPTEDSTGHPFRLVISVCQLDQVRRGFT
ncbi:hypothetical protein Pcinc_042500 [Petrolisthes cinctipes]|uniref:Uncharacterized protein n=1 Tax=Petrolisthes cinctipes TaxID=88211 RepID=A0AAE1BHU1_PETCI|nr:hypothetical protein Pcinc_042500 [Petrolisthes cinctipes]